MYWICLICFAAVPAQPMLEYKYSEQNQQREKYNYRHILATAKVEPDSLWLNYDRVETLKPVLASHKGQAWFRLKKINHDWVMSISFHFCLIWVNLLFVNKMFVFAALVGAEILYITFMWLFINKCNDLSYFAKYLKILALRPKDPPSWQTENLGLNMMTPPSFLGFQYRIPNITSNYLPTGPSATL